MHTDRAITRRPCSFAVIALVTGTLGGCALGEGDLAGDAPVGEDAVVPGACAVQGAIRERWLALGGEQSVLGLCITNELPTPDGRGRFNHFERGSIYWTPTTGAHEVHGALRERWSQLGWETSPLGYPTSDELAIEGGAQANFERGALRFDALTGAVSELVGSPELCAVPPGADPRIFVGIPAAGLTCERIAVPLAAPRHAIEARDGSLFVTEQRAGRLLRLDPSGGVVVADGFMGPIGVAEGPAGELYVVEENRHTLTRVERTGAKTIVADQLANATYLTLHGDGAAYVSSFTTFEPTAVVRRVALDGSSGPAGTVVATGLHVPEGLFFDDLGRLFVAEWATGRVLRFDGGGGAAASALPVATGLEHVYGVVADGAGGFYVADTANRVLHVDAAGASRVVLTNVAAPSGLSVTADGDLLIAELVDLSFNATGYVLRLSPSL